MLDIGPALTPGAYTWTLTNLRRRDGVQRTFEQTELPIEGEARLIGIARKLGWVLGEAGYTYGELDALLDDNKQVDWDKVGTLAEYVAEHAPDLVADTVVVLLGIYPTDEDGIVNPSFDEDRKWLKGAVNITRFVDMLRVFMAQNEYERLARPFSSTLAEAMAAYGTPQSVPPPASSVPSEEGLIVSLDGSPIELEPSPATHTNGEVQPSENDSLPLASSDQTVEPSSTPTPTRTDEPDSGESSGSFGPV